jgi:hypothetical protein
MRRKIYVASSWRNPQQPSVVTALRQEHEVYDFRNPLGGDGGFHWEQIDGEWKMWGLSEYVHHLETNPIAAKGFKLDQDALNWADTCVLLLPCGRSAHLEAGYCAGQGKDVIIALSEEEPPEFELMYLLCGGAGGARFVTNTAQLCTALRFETNNTRMHDLAEHAWALSNRDVVRAVEILRDLTGLSFELAFAAIDDVRPLECADLIEDSEPL